ncbi:SAM-dependent methyltransferase [Microbacterium tumbae]
MSEVIPVSSDWLALREAEDARARSQELVERAAGMLPGGPLTVHDLGSGTGSMMRWLAPRLPGPQHWVLHDWNISLPEIARAGVAPVDADGRPVEIGTRIGELARLDADALRGASLVTASALLDVLTLAEVTAIVEACIGARAPAFFSLSVTGEVRLSPRDARDAVYREGFNAHQRREVDGRSLLGPSGAGAASRLFGPAGWSVRTARTVWMLGSENPALLAEWFEGWADAAEEQNPALRRGPGAYRPLRERQLREGELTVAVAHTDLLAWPS